MHACAYEVAIESVGVERRVGCHEQGNGLQAGIKRLVSRLLVGIHLTAPETLAVQSHVPVAEVVLHKVGDSTSGFGGFVGVVCLGYLLNEGVEFGEYPKVDLSITIRFVIVSFSTRYRLVIVFGSRRPVVHIGIQGKECIGVVKCAEELPADLAHAFGIKFQVVPRRTICQHVPSYSVCAVLIHCAEWIDGIAQSFGHFVAGFVQHQAVAYNIFECDLAFDHRVYSVQGKEPSSRLIHAFGDEVGSTRSVGVLERVVVLRVGHST